MGNSNVPDKYQPISMWGYFGYELLFSIPVVGFIILVIIALGGSSNVNVKNFARSKFCVVIIYLIIIAIIALGGGGAALYEALVEAGS